MASLRQLFDSLSSEQRRNQDLLRRLAAFEPGSAVGFGSDDQQLLVLDRLVQRCLPKAALFATSVTARGRTRGPASDHEPSQT